MMARFLTLAAFLVVIAFSASAAIILPSRPVAVSAPVASTTGLLGISASVTDTTGIVWTVHGNGCAMQAPAACQIYRNSVVDSTTSNVILIVFWQGVIYQEINTGLWWSWNGSAWVYRATTPPPGWVGISNITLSSYSCVSLCTGTLGTLSVTLSTGTYSGTAALSSTGQCAGQGPNNVSFTVTGSAPTFNSNANGSLGPGTYIHCEVYTQAGLDNTGAGVAWTITASNPSTALVYANDNATNSAGSPADTFTSFAFPYGVWQGVLSEPERVIVWNTTGASLNNVAISYSGTFAADFSTAETNCTGTLANNSYCRVIVNFKPSTATAETGNNLVVTFTGGSSALPISGTGTAAGTIVNATCSTFAGNPTLAANTLYLFPTGTTTCSNVRFHTSNGSQVQGDCTAYDGIKTIFDGTSSVGLITNGIGDGSGGDGTSNVVIRCVQVKNYGATGSCTGPTTSSGHPQFNMWTGWLVTNATLGPSCGTGGNPWSTATIRNSHITGNIYNGMAPGINGGNSAAGTMQILGDAFDNNSTSTGNFCANANVGECASFKITNYHGANGRVQDVTVTGMYSHETNTPTPQGGGGTSGVQGAWCDGCYDSHFLVTGSTFIGDTGDGIRCEITTDQATTHTEGDFQHNVFSGNDSAAGQGQAVGVGCWRMHMLNNFIDSTTPIAQSDTFDGSDSRANNQSLDADFENNIVVMRVTCPGFGAGVCWGIGSLGGSGTVAGSTVMKNNTFYTSGPYNTGSAIFIGPDALGTTRTFAQMQAAGWELGSTITSGTPSGSPSGCTGDGKYPAGCVGSGM